MSRRDSCPRVTLACAFFAGVLTHSASGCSTATLKCDGEYPTVNFRTLDWPDLGDSLMSNKGHIMFEPAGNMLFGTLGEYDTPIKYGFASHFLEAGSTRLTIDGMNENGLGCSILEQLQPFATTQADAGSNATKIQMPDICSYLLANYGTVEEIRSALANKEIMVDTSIPPTKEGQESLIDLGKMTGGQLVTETDPITYGFHVMVTDGATDGQGLVYEGDQWLNSDVLANDPSMEEQMQKVKNVTDPTQIAYNDETRFERLYYSLGNCTEYMFPKTDSNSGEEYKWSPGFQEPPAGMDHKTYMALKRAETILNGFVIPRSPLWDSAGESTQVMYMKSPEDGKYYWKTPRDNRWHALDLQELSKTGVQEEFDMYTTGAGAFGTPATPLGSDADPEFLGPASGPTPKSWALGLRPMALSVAATIIGVLAW